MLEVNLTQFFFSDRFVPGVYAISVAGRLPHSAITEMQRRGITYKQRDLADRR